MSDATFYAKPIRVRAFQWLGPRHGDYPLWFDALIRKGAVAIRSARSTPVMRIARPGMTAVVAEVGHWVVNRGDTIIVHRPGTFEKLYSETPVKGVELADVSLAEFMASRN